MAANIQMTFKEAFSCIEIVVNCLFVSKCPFNNKPAMVQIMTLHRMYIKSLSEPALACFLTHVCDSHLVHSSLAPVVHTKHDLIKFKTFDNNSFIAMLWLTQYVDHFVTINDVGPSPFVFWVNLHTEGSHNPARFDSVTKVTKQPLRAMTF